MDHPHSVLPSISRDALDRLFAEGPAVPAATRTVQKLCVIGVDPDIGGAIAVLQWDLTPGAAQVQLQDATIEVHDMPVVTVSIGKKNRR